MPALVPAGSGFTLLSALTILRVESRNNRANGLKGRFFTVTIPICRCAAGRGTGNIFKATRIAEARATDAGSPQEAGLLASLMTAGVFDSTGADGTGWMREIGFRHIRTEPLTLDRSMVGGIK